MRGLHCYEGFDRQTHAHSNSTCNCTVLGIFIQGEIREETTQEIATHIPVSFDGCREPEKLDPKGKMLFRVDGKDCSVSGYDILPRGDNDILPSGKIIVADARQKILCIFGPSATPRNILHCKMRLNRNKNVLDVAALTPRSAVFVAENENTVYFVVAGKRFRHMEIVNVKRTNCIGRRVCYFDNKIYIVGTDENRSQSCIEIFSLHQQWNIQRLMTVPCGKFHHVNSIAVSTSYIFVTSVSAGIRVYDHAGNNLTAHYRDGSYRDIDVQWYYGVTKDKYDNWFVCTQDELGPEIYRIKLNKRLKVDDNSRYVEQLHLQITYRDEAESLLQQQTTIPHIPQPLLRITTEQGLEPPLTLCYHPRLDLIMVGSNHIDEQNDGLRKFRSNTRSRDPYLSEKEAREKFALDDVSWRTIDCDLYEIIYKSTDKQTIRTNQLNLL